MSENFNKIIDEISIGVELLSMLNITKIYENGFVANKDVNFTVKKGEIHGLVGENGAGKTTLMKVLFGQEKSETGKIIIANREVNISNPLDALRYGIGMVHQHFMLVDSLSVAENMVLGNEPVNTIFFNRNQAVKMARDVSEKYDLPIDPNALIRDLSVGYKQRVEILKMLLHGTKILLLDEPTAVLTPQETVELFKQLKLLKAKGYSIVFISHKLNEIKQICDRITVLRNGKSIATVNTDEVNESDISRLMVGRDVFLNIEKKEANPSKIALKVRNLSCVNKFGLYAFHNINFNLRFGEILGVAGVEGNGQAELANAIAGLEAIQEGDVEIEGISIKKKSIKQIRNLGLSMIHEDRMSYGASSEQSIADNIISERYDKCENLKHGFLNLKKIKEDTKGLIDEFKIKADSYHVKIKTLSGGNIQKVVAAREFSSKPKVLIASHPTRGIDVGAQELIRKKMIELRDEQESAVLLFSADLSELLNGSDSIMVMYGGEIVAYFESTNNLTEEMLGEYMLGLKKQSKQELEGLIHE